ncbi:MAG: PAS domain S-box protein [Comamonadaceae bacterium]|nr:MAG: PAS domain S-box protein [Comamonadaceae bacterium]
MRLPARDTLLRALAWWLAACIVAVLTGCGGGHEQPRVHDGTLDLRDWSFSEQGMVALDGGWQFSPGEFTEPGATGLGGTLEVPGPWNDVALNGAPMGGNGFGTYRLTISCTQARDLALSLPMQHSALRLYVNGRAVATQGTPGTTAELSRPAPVQQIVHLADQPCPLKLVAHISNFDIRRGGFMRSMTLGTRQQVHDRRELNMVRDLSVMGALFVMGVLPILFFFTRRNDRSPLYFGLFCLTLALLIGLTGERVLQPLAAPLGWNIFHKLIFIGFYMTQALFALFVWRQYPGQFNLNWMRFIVGWGMGASVAVMVTPTSLFSESVVALQAGAVLVAGCMVLVLVRAVRQKRNGSVMLLGGLLLLIVCTAHDAIRFTHLLTMALTPWGAMAFVAGPAVLLARRFSRALSAEELRSVEQRERADLVMRATKAGVLDWNAIAGTVKYSERFLEMLGYPAGTPQNSLRNFYDMIHQDEREMVRTIFAEQLRDRSHRNSPVRQFQAMEYRLRCVGGGWLWVHAEGIGITGSDGRTLRFICSFIDISAIKQHEADMKSAGDALATERERLRLLVRSTKAGFGDWDAERDVVTYSDRFKEMLGYPADADTSDWPSIFEMMHPEDRDRSRREFRDMIRRKERPGLVQEPGQPMSYRLRRIDGSYIWIHAEGIAQFGEDGNTQRFITSYLDVTTFREQEEALRRSRDEIAGQQKRLELVLRAALVGIVDWDGTTHETWYSPRFREILGHAPDADTSGWPDYFKVMIHPDDRERVTRRWVKFILGKGPEGQFGEFYSPEEYRMIRADGSYAWMLVSGMAVRDNKGFVTRWIAAAIDTTERRAQEEALRESRDQISAQAALLESQNETLKENVRLREEVERIGRHDIKTPLNSIIAVPRLLREERELSADENDLLGIVERAGYRILSMVNLSLDLYKMENGSYIFRPDAVDLADLTAKVIADLRSHAESKHVELHVARTDRPAYAWAEELLCYSLIANLLKNAVEASPENGRVTVTFSRDDARDIVQMEIHNAGAIPQSIRKNFFQKYATAGKASGTGLGAYSAQLMARVQDGTILMQTSDTDGTRMTVELKAAPVGIVPVTVRHVGERSRGAVQQLARLPPLDVLLVDDDEYNLLIVRRFLPTPPLTVRTAINGRLALEMAAASWPDVIFMDLDMPVMGGMEAVGMLRAAEAAMGFKRCSMFALSSHDDAATQAAAIQAGFDKYLTKPVTRQAIHAALAIFAGDEAEYPDRAAGSAPVDADGAQDVMIDPDMQSMIGGFIESRLELLDALEAAAHAVDRSEIRRIAHQLAGSFSLYGFNWASAQSRVLETGAPDVEPEAVLRIVTAVREHLQKVAASVT